MEKNIITLGKTRQKEETNNTFCFHLFSVPLLLFFIFCGSHNSCFILNYPLHKTRLLLLLYYYFCDRKNLLHWDSCSFCCCYWSYFFLYQVIFHPFFPYFSFPCSPFIFLGRHWGATRTPIYAHALQKEKKKRRQKNKESKVRSLALFPLLKAKKTSLVLFFHTHTYLAFEALNSFINQIYKLKLNKLHKKPK